MQTNAEVAFLDSSAVVKLVVRERETGELERFLIGRPHHVSCALLRVEVVRAARSRGEEAVYEGRRILRYIHQIALDDELLNLASEIGPAVLCSLDAIHLAAA